MVLWCWDLLWVYSCRGSISPGHFYSSRNKKKITLQPALPQAKQTAHSKRADWELALNSLRPIGSGQQVTHTHQYFTKRIVMRPTDLHEEASDQRSADVDVVVSAVELSAPPRQIEAVHDPGQLLPYVVRRHQRAVVDKVVIAPLGGVVVCWRKGSI